MSAIAQLKFINEIPLDGGEKTGFGRLYTLRPGRPHPELAGRKVRTIGATPIYLIDRHGYRRLIPFPLAFINLFNDISALQGVTTGHSIEDIAPGPPLDENAIMVRSACSETVYLMDNGKKRLISGPEIMRRYGFEESCVVVVPQIVVDAIPMGESWG